jgi:cell division protein FtsI/penicillin-binding protein 2
MKVNNSERNRVFLLFMLFCLWVLFIGASLVKVQVFEYGKNISKVQAQISRIIPLFPKRGTIYDCNGEVLAISVKTQSLYFNNINNEDTHRLFNEIIKRKILSFNWEERKSIKKRIDHGEKFIWVKRKLSDYETEKLKEINNKEISVQSSFGFLEEYKRVYPQKKLAAHILGGVGIDEQGLYGLEYSVDSLIRGKEGKMKIEQDARRKAFDFQYVNEPEEGKDAYLTIDASVQFFVEKELEATVIKHNAKSGVVIVMDSREGAILAMASYPGFVPDEIQSASTTALKNNAVSFIYHPGSTFKIITTSIALENNICSPQQVFNCYNGTYPVTKDINIYDDHPYSQLSFEDIIIHSSNIGAAQIGEKLGKNRLLKGIKLFGFGKKVDIRLQDEESGILNNNKDKWSGISVDFLAYGYEIGVTPLQMIRAYNVIASGGYMVQPYVVKEIQGVVLKTEGEKKKRILSIGTVQRMTSIMTQVVERGTGTNAKIDGIPISAKTGTSKKITKNKDGIRYYISSFGGFFPSDNPRITMFVVVDEPRGQFYGGDVAAPLFKSIAEKLMIYLGIYPELENKNDIRL